MARKLPTQSSSVFRPFPGSQLGCEALHTIQLFFVVNLARVTHAATVLQDRQNQGPVQE